MAPAAQLEIGGETPPPPLQSAHGVDALAEHLRGHQGDAPLGDVEAPRPVGLMVYANTGRFVDADAAIAVDDGLADGAVTAYVHVREDHGVLHRRIGIDPDIGEQERVAHHGPGDDAPARDHGVHRHAAAVVVVEDELGGRKLLLVGPHGPLLVVEVERWGDTDQFQVGLPEGVHGADIAPVELGPGAGVAEGEGEHPVLVDDRGDDVLAEVVTGAAGVGVLDDLFEQEVPVEDVDPHGGQGLVVRARGSGPAVPASPGS